MISAFVNVEEVKTILCVSDSKAYQVIKKLNNELSKKGFLVVQGRVSRKYFFERFYGLDYEEGEKENACI